MKIGILTFHRTLNYGAVLQCFALKEFLQGLGHDVEVIDYRPQCIEKERWAFYYRSFKKKTLMEKLKTLCLFPFKYIYKRKSAKAFDSFLNRNFKFSAVANNKSDIPHCYDVIIFGSDQIWSPIICEGFDHVYYGAFHKGNTRFVSYAASLEGFNSFSNEQWNHIANYMNNFDAISVRENTLCQALSKHVNRPVDCVVDPTLLVPSSIFQNMVKKQTAERYVFLFTVQKGDLAYKIAQRIAHEKNIIVVRLRATKRLNIQHGEHHVKQLFAQSPDRFVELINNAECVVTNSFHATAISLQLGKDFYSVKSEYSSRVKNLLSSVNLNSRYVSSAEEFKEEPAIDYNQVATLLQQHSAKSKEYIISNIK